MIPNVYRVALNWQHTNGQTATNVMHFRRSASTATEVAGIIDANVTAGMWGHTSSGARVTSIDVTPLNGSGATVNQPTSGAKWTGAAGTDPFIPAAACVVSLRTGNRGRRNRGRIFMPFIAEGAFDNGTIANAIATQGVWTTFVAAMNTASCQLCVASYLGSYSSDVTTILVEPRAGTVRRRQSRLWR